MTVLLREYRKEDFSALRGMVRRTWRYDDFSSPENAEKLAGVFLSSCLTNYTYSRVAIDNGKPAGIILANHKAKHHCPAGLRLQQIRAILSMCRSREGRKILRVFRYSDVIDKELLKGCGTDYPAELALFAVDPSSRGKGIGKKLFQSAVDYMKAQKLDRFYLFTDTSCDYGFYDHQGMVKKGEKSHTFAVDDYTEKMTFFIYDSAL